ncbi:MAG: hypothetical protein IRZ05_13000 [Micromonosporaceae bacterium]|jgi:hypothetical protein|nr:hypothetical protein [Micromonosporaceae bacterium]
MQPDRERVLYEGRSARSGMWIRVTTRWCVVGEDHYPVAELTLVGSARGERDLFRARKAAGLVVVLAVLVVAAVAIRSGRTREIWTALGVTVAATAAVTALPGALGRFLRRTYQIWAIYRGAHVLLFDTADQEQYGQVARALIRARELTLG